MKIVQNILRSFISCVLFTYLIEFLDDKDPIVEFDRSCSSRGLAGLLLTESRAGAELRADNYNIGGACH